jgi:hypothetical protein
MDFKLIYTIIATAIIIMFDFPYLRDIFLLKTKPHVYTWLIWFITQGTATAGILYGGGGWGVLGPAVGLFFVFIIFLLSLKYGTKNITTGDNIALVVHFSEF